MKDAKRFERGWGVGLIVVGVVLLGIVFVSAFAIAGDPGGYYDEWVPGEAQEGPEASFDWSSDGLVVEFIDTSSIGDAAIERWVWDFGDGAEGAEATLSHRFGEAGEHVARLDVVDGNGLSSQAEATIDVEAGAANSGEGVLGLNDLADSAIETAERSAKGMGVVVLVIGMFVVLTMIGGRLVRQGVRALRPIPDRISVKLRPKELELAVAEARDEKAPDALPPTVAPPIPVTDESPDRVTTGV